MHLIAEILNSQAWERTKAKSSRSSENLSEDESESECEDDLEFADEAILVFMKRLEVPFKNAGLTISEGEMLEESRDLLDYAKRSKSTQKKILQIF